MALTIGFDGHVLTGRFQGTRTTVTNLLRALSARMGDHRLIVYSDDPQAARDHLGVDIYDYQSLGGCGSLKRLLAVFPRLFKRDKVDLGVFQYMTPLTGRNIVFIHDILPITHPHLFPLKVRMRTRIFFSLAIWRAAMVLTVSDYTRRQVEKTYKLPASKLATVLNGPSFPPETYVPSRAPAQDDRYILIVGRIEPRKNVPLLVDAVIQAAIPDVRLVIVGSFDLGFDYRIPDAAPVEIRSGVKDEELIELYRGASLFAYPTQAEGFGVPLLDAILFGLPVVASDQTSLPEVGGTLARYFDPTATDARDTLARIIKGHFTDAPIPTPSEEQRAEHAQRFSWDGAAEAFTKVLDRLERDRRP